jgi:hypothetical protein
MKDQMVRAALSICYKLCLRGGSASACHLSRLLLFFPAVQGVFDTTPLLFFQLCSMNSTMEQLYRRVCGAGGNIILFQL